MYIVRMENINKSFFGVKVLDDVHFYLKQGECHALIGENGAGKSTLIKILCGAIDKDGGDIYIEEKKADIKNPIYAKNIGIQTIYQELSLAPDLTIVDNMFLGAEKMKYGLIDEKESIKKAEEIVKSLNLDIDVRKKVKDIGVGQKYFTEICRCLIRDAKIVIMDEPTSAMTTSEFEAFLKIVNTLKEKEISIIYISHKLDEIFKICDAVTVLRDGKHIETTKISDVTLPELIRLMIGKDLAKHLKSEDSDAESKGEREAVLELRNITTNKLKDISFKLHEGEVLGITGLLGAGKTEIARALFGADKIISGEIYINNIKTKINKPIKAMEKDIALLPEDRKASGLHQGLNIRSNVGLVNLHQFKIAKYLISNKKETIFVKKNLDLFHVKYSNLNQKVKSLSGGNQQKTIFAKWIARKAKILLLDEPTRGIDVGAKEEIFEIIKKLSEEGVSIIVFSSETEEILRISNRILVMNRGAIRGELGKKEATKEKLLMLCNVESDIKESTASNKS